MKCFIIVLLALALCSCSSIISTVQKNDADIAKYLGVTEFTNDCKAGIVQADVDVSDDPVLIRKASAVTQYADKESEDYKLCYSKIAWLYWSGAKAEGAIRTWVKKLVELGVLN